LDRNQTNWHCVEKQIHLCPAFLDHKWYVQRLDDMSEVNRYNMSPQDTQSWDAVTKLYDKVDTYYAEDQWYFDIPFTIWCRKPLCSHGWWLVNARILVESQNNMQWVVSIHSTSTILTYRPWGQFGMWCLNGLDPSDSISKQACWICGVPICCDPVENNKSLTLISFLYLHWCRQLHRYQNHRPNDDADLVA
jgi:hypothetical protein